MIKFLQGSNPDREIGMRIECQQLILRIPKQGIQEVFETLKDIYEFHSSQLERENLFLPHIEQVQARYGTTTIRPEFPVVYDEELDVS